MSEQSGVLEAGPSGQARPEGGGGGVRRGAPTKFVLKVIIHGQMFEGQSPACFSAAAAVREGGL